MVLKSALRLVWLLVLPGALFVLGLVKWLDRNGHVFTNVWISGHVTTAQLPRVPGGQARKLHERVEKRALEKSLSVSSPRPPAEIPEISTLLVAPELNSGRLGNFMFVVASLFGIAKSLNRTAVLFEHKPFMEYFDLPLSITARGNLSLTSRTAHVRGAFESSMSSLANIKQEQLLVLNGYFLSWKYFSNVDARHLFRISPDIYDQASRHLFMFLSQAGTASTLLVGVHVRRGDLLRPENYRYGHNVAPDAYLLKTTALLRAKHANETITFVFFSDTMECCRRLFRNQTDVVCFDVESDIVTLSALSLMDIVVLTVGTFGWWGAFLSDAKEVYYYADWPRFGSKLAEHVVHEDYFPPTWIPG